MLIENTTKKTQYYKENSIHRIKKKTNNFISFKNKTVTTNHEGFPQNYILLLSPWQGMFKCPQNTQEPKLTKHYSLWIATLSILKGRIYTYELSTSFWKYSNIHYRW